MFRTLEEYDYVAFGLVSKIAGFPDEILRNVCRCGTGERSGRLRMERASSGAEEKEQQETSRTPHDRAPRKDGHNAVKKPRFLNCETGNQRPCARNDTR